MEGNSTEGKKMNDLVGKKVKLKRPVRAGEGKQYFTEIATILRVSFNLDREMYLVGFDDGATTFLFPNEVEFVE